MSKFSQFFPPTPSFTEHELPDQIGKVFIVTGAASGIGLELTKILFGANATVYLAARSLARIDDAIRAVRLASPKSTGRLEPMALDLSDLSTIKPATDAFLARESRLDGLVHNAGVMNTSPDTLSAQGHELQMATHVLGPFLLTRLLSERLADTAKTEKRGAVRVIWVTSMISVGTPKGGIIWDKDAGKPVLAKAAMDNYMQSKVGSVFLAREYARRLGEQGIISVSVHPGMMKTDLQRNMPTGVGAMMGLMFKGPKFGAYSQLFALLSPEVTPDKNGSFIIPWGRFGEIPSDISIGMDDGGSGLSRKFWAWCERETAAF